MKLKRLILSVLCTAAMLSGMAVSAAANSLPEGFLIGDQDGISVTVDGDYFIDAQGLRPGDVITKRLTMRNNDRENTPYILSMTAEPMETTGPVDLLNEIDLLLTLDGERLYKGRVRGDDDVDMINNALKLGTYAGGDSKVLDITLTVSDNFKINYSTSEAFLGWHFYAARPEVATPPKTGEIMQYALYAVTLGAMLMISIILIGKKKKQQEEQTREAAFNE